MMRLEGQTGLGLKTALDMPLRPTFRMNSLSPLEYVLNTSKCCNEAMPLKVILTSLCL